MRLQDTVWLMNFALRQVVGIFRIDGAMLLKQKDEWVVQRASYMTLETINQMSDDPLVGLPAVPS
jgi:putative transposase